MLKKIIIAVAVLVVAGAAYFFISSYIDKVNLNKLETFNIAKYEYYIDNFGGDKVLGKISDTESAIQKAEQIWVEIYGTGVKMEKPYKAAWDAKSGTWHIYGSSSADIFVGSDGGVVHMLIRKSDGKVLAVWHQK